MVRGRQRKSGGYTDSVVLERPNERAPSERFQHGSGELHVPLDPDKPDSKVSGTIVAGAIEVLARGRNPRVESHHRAAAERWALDYEAGFEGATNPETRSALLERVSGSKDAPEPLSRRALMLRQSVRDAVAACTAVDRDGLRILVVFALQRATLDAGSDRLGIPRYKIADRLMVVLDALSDYYGAATHHRRVA